MNLLDFDTAVTQSDAISNGKRHLLLGNGFSRAWRDSLFSYDSIFDATSWTEAQNGLRASFDSLGTRDFEKVMEVLEDAYRIATGYGIPENIRDIIKSDSSILKDLLTDTLSKHHPENPEEVKDSEYQKCGQFLGNFERIYTVNYDLLLYWTLMKGRRKHDDGFRDPFEGEPEDYVEEDFVEWKYSDKQTVYYLHGALHLQLSGPSLKKFCWSRTGVKLKDQILESLNKRSYPLIVAAGTSDEKLSRIQRSNYLGHAYRSIGKIGGSLFVFGHSFGDKDSHIFDQVKKNKSLKAMCVGIFGDTNSAGNKHIIERARSISSFRKIKNPRDSFEVSFFDAKSANVWR